MFNSLVNLFSRSWTNLVTALGTTNLSIVVFSVAVPLIVFVVAVGAAWRSTGYSMSELGKILGEAFWPTAIATIVTAVVWIAMFGWSTVRTVYVDHQTLVQRAINAEKKYEDYVAQAKKTKPDFEAKLYQVATGPAGGGKDLVVIITGNIRNHGTPGTVDEIWVDLAVDDSRIIHGKFPLPPSPNQTITIMQHPKLLLGGDTLWMRNTRERPILTDTGVDGWVLAVFDGITVEEAIQKKATVIFTASDITGKKFSSKWTLLPPDRNKLFTMDEVQKPKR
jgi:hypothetical protein